MSDVVRIFRVSHLHEYEDTSSEEAAGTGCPQLDWRLMERGYSLQCQEKRVDRMPPHAAPAYRYSFNAYGWGQATPIEELTPFFSSPEMKLQVYERAVVTSSMRYMIDIYGIPIYVAQPISQVRLLEYPATTPSSLISGAAVRRP